jgi:hypothetical protein
MHCLVGKIIFIWASYNLFGIWKGQTEAVLKKNKFDKKSQ